MKSQVVILPNTASDGAFHVAQEIHKALEQLNIPHAASAVKHHVTLSIGIATVIPTPNMVPLDLIEAADQALYQAKANGRNCSCIKNNIIKHPITETALRFCSGVTSLITL